MVRPLKEAKTYQEQINILINNHRLIITNRVAAEKILSNVNYYRLSAFGIGLKQMTDREKYQAGISLLGHLYSPIAFGVSTSISILLLLFLYINPRQYPVSVYAL